VKICLIEPFHAGSHATWAKEYARYSRHEVQLLTLSGRRWKWRMHGGAVTLARLFIEEGLRPDLLLASDMLDLTTFLALTRDVTATLPAVLYFHENQLTYPWSSNSKDVSRQHAHYAFINYTSAMAADSVCFNSCYHKDAFTQQLPGFLKSFPDQNELESVDKVEAKSDVLYLGLDLASLDQHRPDNDPKNDVPLILWNHRWEYDKNPEAFFRALYRLQGEGLEFNVAVLGESYRNSPPAFNEAKERLGKRVVQFGYAQDFADYAQWLWRADILPVTSDHDFFGASVVQAIYCGATPLLPKRLAYPAHLSDGMQSSYLYDENDDITDRLRSMILNYGETGSSLRDYVARYDWQEMVTTYDDLFEEIFRMKQKGAIQA
jgi:glycosyltransferase involved in cell wall biosynthesis